MKGRIKRLQVAFNADRADSQQNKPLICPLCERIIPDAQRDAHHLVPKSRGGVETVWLHRICHRQVHALLNENELARHYCEVRQLREHPGLAVFIRWVRSKPADFFERTRKSKRLRA
jgi:hypothetical protein